MIKLKNILLEGIRDPHIFKVVFMAGSPGAGKSTVADFIKGGTGLKTVNFDELYTYFKDRDGDVDFDKTDTVLNKKMNLYIDGRLGLIVDKTGQDYNSIKTLKTTLESIGYDSAMVFVNIPLHISKERVISRFKKTGRNVDPKYIEKSYKNLINNLGKYQSDFGKNMFIIDNESKFDEKLVHKRLTKFLNEPVNHIAKQWINNQK